MNKREGIAGKVTGLALSGNRAVMTGIKQVRVNGMMSFLLFTCVGLFLLFVMFFHCELLCEETASEARGFRFFDSSFPENVVSLQLAAVPHNRLMNCCLREVDITTQPTYCRSVLREEFTLQVQPFDSPLI